MSLQSSSSSQHSLDGGCQSKSSLPKSEPDPKPIKLKAACNQCFTAKVRCCGNKEGCRRCREKRLPCAYSESRVGKVVGKRRKRPVDDSIGTINSESWIVHNTIPTQPIPSPAFTHATRLSDNFHQRQSHTPSWSTSYAIAPEVGLLNLNECNDSLNAMDMTDTRTHSMTSDISFDCDSGLPTPSLSPPHYTRYLSPALLETRPVSRQSACTIPFDHIKLHPQRYPIVSRTVDLSMEDEETVCIKLLAHLKKHAGNSVRSRDIQVELLNKSNAVVRRLLRSPSVRTEYTCHLLLSSIINQLVYLCENICQANTNVEDSQFMQASGHFEGLAGFVNNFTTQNDQEMVANLVREVVSFTLVVGEFLKKNSFEGFQHQGRHECFHVELEERLRRASEM